MKILGDVWPRVSAWRRIRLAMNPAFFVMLILLSGSGCSKVWKPGGLESAATPTGPQTEVVTHQPQAYRIIRINNELRFAILQNVTGDFPPPGTELEVYRQKDKIGTLVAGSQSGDTFFSADISDGTILDTDIAFYLAPTTTDQM